jgi:Type II secretion system (T2SS), protein E, N-terminal domain
VTLALARSLLLADAVSPAALAEALFLSATRGTSLVRTLLAARAIDALRLEQMLERGEAPYMRHIAPVMVLVERLPPGLCDRLLAMPVRHDPRTGTVDVAVVDARDPHPAEEIGYWLKAPVRMVRTSIASMESALLRLGDRIEADTDLGMRALAPPIGAPPSAPAPPHVTRTPLYGMPAPAARGTSDPPLEDPDLAIPLTRRNLGAPPVAQLSLEATSLASAPVEIGPPAIERFRRPGDSDPVLDLRRRKPLPGPPVQVDPGYGPASTVRGPFAPMQAPAPGPPAVALGRPPSLHPAAAEPVSVPDRMRGARDRDEIFDLLVAGTRSFSGRVVVLAVRRDALAGWTGSAEIADRAALRAVRLPSTSPTVLHRGLEDPDPRLVRIPADAAHAPLLSVMRSAPDEDVALAPVQAEGRPVALVVADGLGDGAAAIERLGVLARAAGEALGRLLRDRRT